MPSDLAALDVSLEITPPKRDRPEILLRRARLLGARVRQVNVISRRDRQSSLDASLLLRRHGFEPVWHVANRGRCVVDIEAEIERAREGGLSRMLCIRGEYKAPDTAETPKIREVVRLLARMLPGASVAVCLDPHHGPRALRNLWPKLEAGAERIQTQVSFDLEALLPIADEILLRAPDVSIVPMLMPVLSRAAAVRTSRRLSIPLPTSLESQLAQSGEAAGWAHVARLVAGIAADERFAGVAIMTPMDPGPDFARKLGLALAPQD